MKRRPIPLLALAVAPALLVLLVMSGTAAAQQAATSPHGTLRSDIRCTNCHTQEAWSPTLPVLAFSHEADAGFRLAGRHARLECGACHLALRFDEPHAAGDDCAACHVDVHQGRLAGPCTGCHDTESFRGAARVRSHARTSFPLTGAHLRADCEACHQDDAGGAFTRVASECVSCHAPEYEQTDFPDHAALAYSTDCRSCHGTASWHGAAFDHAAAGLPLVGAHTRIACAVCHLPPSNEPVVRPAGPDDCVACHRDDYDREHGGSGFPTTCATCHSPNDWDGAGFEHDARFFPIYSGEHRGEWRRCEECHPTPGNFTVFTCLTCHTRAETDSDHRGESGYVYDSARCLACHPRGED